ncbi:MAG: S9 family peptidase [Parachlamydiaceae bacterium]
MFCSPFFFSWLSCLIALFFSFLHAEDQKVSLPPLIPRQLLFGHPVKASAKLSYDGTKLAYLAPDSKNILNVWVRDLEKKEDDKQVTHDTKRGIRQFLWSFDHRSILYIQDKDGDENWHLYQANLLTNTTKDLTPFDGVKVEILDADAHFPDEMLIQMNKRDPTLFDVYRLNLKTGQLEIETENPGNVIGWIADHHLQVRASQSLAEDGSTVIQVRDKLTTPWRNWMTIPPTEIVEIQGFTSDNQSLYVMTSVGANTSRLLKVNLDSGQQTMIAQDPNYDLSTLIVHPTTYALEAVGVDREKYEWILLDAGLAGDFQFLKEHLQGSFTLASRDLANQNWIVVSQSDRRPSHFYLYRRSVKSLEFLFSTQPDLERYTLSPMEPITFQSRDGMILHGYLTLPQGGERNLPAVLLVHGGPWARDSWGLQPMVQWLANRGYAVLQINFRGSTGYGKAYLNAGNREWAGKMHDDLLDGKEWMVAKGIADPKKIAIVGGSYGGYATLVGLTFTPDAFCCGIDIVGPSNLVTLLQTLPPYWKPMKVIMDIRLGKVESEEAFLKSRSPFFKVDQIKKPLLIAQGANDPRVKQSESDQIVKAMRDKQIPVEYLLFPDEGHGFARPENRLKFYAVAELFLSKYLGGRSEPASSEENWESLKH